MDWNRIEQLIEKYYDAQTSLAEENEIRQALNREDCPAHLQAEAELMSFFTNEKKIALQKQINYSLESPQKKGKLIAFISKFSGAAAAIALLCMIFFMQRKQCNNQRVLAIVNQEKICDEEVAKQKAKEALQLVAAKLNQGTSKLEYIESINTANRITN